MVTHANSTLLLNEVLSRWESGQPADAQAALAQFPALAGRKSCVVELAYEEWCQRIEAGTRLDIDLYCARFSSCASSLRKRLQFDEYYREHPDLFEAAWPTIGERFGDLELVAELGRGAMGRVFLARDHALAERPLVLKLAADASSEAETLSRVSHPGVVPIHFVRHDAERGLSGICMPLLSRTTLQDVLDYRLASADDSFPDILRRMDAEYDDEAQLAAIRAATPAADPPGDFVHAVAWLGARLAAALAHVHERGVLHLDLKPSNVLVTPAGAPMLIDFNLSMRAGLRSPFYGGTPQYMSPEQLTGFVAGDDTRHVVGPASDVYSLGAVLYELLARRHPLAPLPQGLPMATAASVLRARQAAQIPSPAEHCPHADSELCGLILRCLAERPEDRPTAAELAGAFENQLTPAGRSARWASLHRRGLITAGLAGLAGLAIGGGYWLTRPPRTQRWAELGWQQYRADDFQLAMESFSAGLDADPSNYDALFGRGRSELKLGDWDASYRDFKRAFQLHPDGRYAAGMGYIDLKRGATVRGRSNFEEALRAGFSSPELWCDVGYAQRLLTTQDAEQSLLRATELAPEFALPWQNLVRLEVQQKGGVRASEIPVAFSPRAREYVENAARTGAKGPMFHLDAAIILGCLVPSAEREAVVLKHLKKAAEAKCDRANFLRVARLFRLERQSEVVALAAGLPKEAPPEVLYADPLASLDR